VGHPAKDSIVQRWMPIYWQPFLYWQRTKTLPERFHDHPLTGEYTHHCECHLKPDLLLIYKKPDDQTLRLVRVGSHSEVF
jgi:addiction module RelE/StbE family toxin